jgi:hypothetical protein
LCHAAQWLEKSRATIDGLAKERNKLLYRRMPVIPSFKKGQGALDSETVSYLEMIGMVAILLSCTWTEQPWPRAVYG